MRQTEQVASTFDNPLSPSVTGTLVHGGVLGTNIQSPLANNIQNLIVGGQRIVSPAVHAGVIGTNIQSPGVIGTNIQSPGVIGTNIQTPLGSNVQNLIVGGQRIVSPAANASNVMIQSGTSLVPNHHLSNVNISTPTIPNASGPRQSMVLRLPPQVHSSKGPLKGQIVKTADQRLMFVTEVSGKRVGYLIHQQPQSSDQVPINSRAVSSNVQNSLILGQSQSPQTMQSQSQQTMQVQSQQTMQAQPIPQPTQHQPIPQPTQHQLNLNSSRQAQAVNHKAVANSSPILNAQLLGTSPLINNQPFSR
jgi:hypothetical protein